MLLVTAEKCYMHVMCGHNIIIHRTTVTSYDKIKSVWSNVYIEGQMTYLISSSLRPKVLHYNSGTTSRVLFRAN